MQMGRTRSPSVHCVAFVDESFRVDNFKNSLGGIGGVLKDRMGKKLLWFSGPVEVNDALEAERKALEQMVSFFQNADMKGFDLQKHFGANIKLLIFSDNLALVKDISKNKCVLKDNASLSMEVQHISRVLNSEADLLARNGALLDTLQVQWAGV